MNKIIKTIVGTSCLVFLIASGFPLVTNGGLLRLIGYFNYYSGSIFLGFILYRYFKMEEELKQQLTTEGEGKNEKI
jgi:hypothetical protein